MRKGTTVIVALLLAGCGGSGDDASAEPDQETIAMISGSVSTTQLEATVVFDGEACVYNGPSAVRAGTEVAFEFEATAKPDDIAMIVGGVDPGTTWDQFADWADTTAAGSAPPFAAAGYRIQYGPGSLVMTLQHRDYLVACATSPSDTDENFAVALIEVTEV